MNHLNSLIIEGNAVRNADVSEPKAGFTVCKFPIAVNRWYKNKNDEGVNEVSFFDVEAYGKMAEYCGKQIEKGRGLRVVGHLKQDHWKDEDGKSHSKVYVIAEHIEYKPKFNVSGLNQKLSEQNETEKADTSSEVQSESEAMVF